MDGRPMLEVVAEALTNGLRLAATRTPTNPAADQRDLPTGPARHDPPSSVVPLNLPSPPLVIVGAPGQDLPAVPGAQIVRDDVPDEGPLRGMAAGLAALEGRAEAAYVSSCDVPLLRPAFVARLFDLLGDADIVVPEVEGRHHPLAAVYRVGVLPVVQELLVASRRRPFFLFERVHTRRVGVVDLTTADPDLRSLRNLNTPEDYAAVQEGTASPSAPRRSASTRGGPASMGKAEPS